MRSRANVAKLVVIQLAKIGNSEQEIGVVRRIAIPGVCRDIAIDDKIMWIHAISSEIRFRSNNELVQSFTPYCAITRNEFYWDERLNLEIAVSTSCSREGMTAVRVLQ